MTPSEVEAFNSLRETILMIDSLLTQTGIPSLRIQQGVSVPMSIEQRVAVACKALKPELDCGVLLRNAKEDAGKPDASVPWEECARPHVAAMVVVDDSAKGNGYQLAVTFLTSSLPLLASALDSIRAGAADPLGFVTRCRATIAIEEAKLSQLKGGPS